MTVRRPQNYRAVPRTLSELNDKKVNLPVINTAPPLRECEAISVVPPVAAAL
jgi:hypothetical protein